MRGVRFAPGDDASLAPYREAVAELLLESSPEFYALLPFKHRKDVLDAIGEQLDQSASELGNTRVVWARDQVIGATSIVYGDVVRAKRLSLKLLLRRLEPQARAKALSTLPEFTQTVEPIAVDGVYVARLAISSHARGGGYGRSLLQEIIEESKGRRISLHVHRDNRAAIGLYESAGFERVSSDGYAIRLYTRKIDDEVSDGR